VKKAVDRDRPSIFGARECRGRNSNFTGGGSDPLALLGPPKENNRADKPPLAAGLRARRGYLYESGGWIEPQRATEFEISFRAY